MIDADGDTYQQGGSGTRWVAEGTRTWTDANSPTSLGSETGPPPLGNPASGCAPYKAAIDAAEAEMAAAKAEYGPQIRKLVGMTSALRDFRNDKQIRAWGYLQGAAFLRGEITKLERYLSEIKGEDFSTYES